MKTVRLRPHLGILFVLAVGLPSVALVVMAVRSIAGEEVVLEKRLERTLAAELDHVQALVAGAMDDARDELALAAPSDAGERGRAQAAAWAAASDLVAIPFLLSADDRLVEPSRERELSADEVAFIRWNEEFLAGSVQTPVYLNVGVAYQQEILAAAAGAAAGGSPGDADAATVAGGTAAVAAEEAASAAAPTAATTTAVAGAGTSAEAEARAASPSAGSLDASAAVADRAVARLEAVPTLAEATPSAAQKSAAPAATAPTVAAPTTPAPAEPAATAPSGNQAANQSTAREAVELYKQDESVRKRVLEKAMSEGATPVERLVQPQASATTAEAPAAKDTGEAERPSIFVARQRTFKEIQTDASGGFLPRVVQDELILLYWTRTADGGTAGCVVDLARLSERLAALLPAPFAGERILTLLDDRAEPLVTPPDGRVLDWRRPFVAVELHESLPRWEAASYLADPGLFASRVRQRTSLLGILVAILVASIGGGGTFVLLGLSQELRAAQQRTTFVANVSHELKTPLTSIRMFAEMLRDGRQADPERRRRYLDLMVAESGRLARLVNNVLDFSQLEQGRKRYTMRPVDLAELCRAVLEAERPRLEGAGFTVRLESGPGPSRVTADEDALRQVLGNLLSNAEKYSGDRREITVATGADAGRPWMAVLDRGIGIADEHARRIFREFYRVDDSLTARVKGTGLGLSIARRIARDHGGDLRYEPREGGGSVFRAVLPAPREGGR